MCGIDSLHFYKTKTLLVLFGIRLNLFQYFVSVTAILVTTSLMCFHHNFCYYVIFPLDEYMYTGLDHAASQYRI